ncbi:MAG: hypothetical protein A2033_18570 [Bacteroidetes bacterium GWA2_31_9]|nr:MAG: hypothetical protein A2033_18570 [Bacteroidetes bacterium GWA2_31_9]
MSTFNKILIANRGEIAVRIMRTAKKMGISTVAVYSEPDKDSFHAKFADEAYNIGSADLADSYLNYNKIIKIAKKSNCDAIHPGYGFLSENPKFAAACEENNIIFIGPDSKAILQMGNKIEARSLVKKLNIPMTQSVSSESGNIVEACKKIPLPLLIKAAAGGGGKGMRIVNSYDELADAFEATSREALKYFGDGNVYVEQFIQNPRHIEIQIIGDKHGNCIHLFERECSIQRRYQKIVEESPSATLTNEVRLKMGEAAVKIAKSINYSNAGTIEFLVDKDLNFYFLEMNTRVQVEHPVTEMVTGIDIVEEQIRIASGSPLRYKQDDIKQNGHAIESRIYAENPAKNFMPSPGEITFYQEPEGQNIRIDSCTNKPVVIQSFFDPMIAKLVCWAETREKAILKSKKALSEFIIHGIETNIPYLSELLNNESFIENKISTKFCDEYTTQIVEKIAHKKSVLPEYIPVLAYLLYDLNFQENIEKNNNIWNQIGYWRDIINIRLNSYEKEFIFNIISSNNNKYKLLFEENLLIPEIHSISKGKIWFSLNENIYTAYISVSAMKIASVTIDAFTYEVNRLDVLEELTSYSNLGHNAGNNTNSITSPMPGKVIKINVSENQEVKKGNVLIIVEAMKMENSITAPRDCKIEKINVKAGEMVETSTIMISLTE